MILKDLKRKETGTGQLMKYIFQYMLQEDKMINKESALKPFIIRHNMRSRTVDGFIQEFKINAENRLTKRRNQSLHHTILSWSHKDTPYITDQKLRKMAKEFIRLRGDNNLYVGSKHIDRHHTHLHIAVSGNQLNGRSSRMSKAAFAQMKKDLDAYQKKHYPELSNSLPLHGRSKMNRQLQAEKENNFHTITPTETKELETLQNIRTRKKAIELNKEHDDLEKEPETQDSVSSVERNDATESMINSWPGFSTKRISSVSEVSPG